MENNIYLGKEAKDKLIAGISRVADAAKLTLGAAGRNAILQHQLNPGHIITNDGVSIVKEARFDDPVEQIGANILKEVAQRTDNQSGDGTTTSIVLTQAIINEGLKYESQGMEVKNSLDKLIPEIERLIDEQKKVVNDEDIKSVATISAESEKLGSLIAEIYGKIGRDGIIELDNSKTFDTFYEILEGVRFNVGFMSPYMATDGQAIYHKPYILITEQKINTINDLKGLAEKLTMKGIREMVIICDEIDMTAMSNFILASYHPEKPFKTLIIKAPTVMKDAFFEDMAHITGATIINEVSGTNLRDAEIKHLGTCDKLTVSREYTTVIGIKDISTHLEALKNKDDAVSQFRIKRLNTKAAILKLGANSDVELSYIRLKAEDAVNATKLALEDGIVAGGGVCLLNVANQMPDTIGGKILKQALKAPIKQIIQNAGNPILTNWYDKTVEVKALEIYESELQPSLPTFNGFNAKTGELVDMFKAGIVDPAKVVKNAVRNAISVAGTVLTTEAVLTLPKIKEEQESPFMN